VEWAFSLGNIGVTNFERIIHRRHRRSSVGLTFAHFESHLLLPIYYIIGTCAYNLYACIHFCCGEVAGI